MKAAFTLGSTALGIVLLLLSGAWPSLFPATRVWSDEKELHRIQVQDRIHNLRYLLEASPNQRSFHSHAPVDDVNPRKRHDSAALQAELSELMAVNDQLNAEFASATNRPNTVAAVLKWSGISLAILGIIGWYAVKQSA